MITSLFLIVGDPATGDPARLCSILERLGFLDDELVAEAAGLPACVTLAETAVSVDAGAHVAAMLGEELARGAASTIGLAAVPLWSDHGVIAISFDDSQGSGRAVAAHTIAFVASSIAAMSDGMAIFWPPARLWSTSADLAGAVIAMQANALPPVLHFVAFDQRVEQDAWSIATRGLGWFVGHELTVISQRDLGDMTELMRRAGRLSIDAMVNGPYAPGSVVDGLQPGERIIFETGQQADGVPMLTARIMRGPGGVRNH